MSTQIQNDPSLRPDPTKQLTTRGVSIWFAAVCCLILAVTGRTSFGVAGLYAMDHFHINTAQLAVFTSVQVAVYALSQIPMGRMIDNFGPRRILFGGAISMFIGQLILAFAHVFSVAIVGRIFIGLGDATAFVSVMRLIPEWIPRSKAPLFAQFTGSLGQLGQFLSAIPFAALLSTSSWTTSFISLGAISFVICLAAFLIIRDSAKPRKKIQQDSIREQLRYVVTSRITWRAFFMHWSGFALLTTYTLLWGVPLMKLGMGFSDAKAHSILVIITIGCMVFAPFMGILSGRLPHHRSLANVISMAIVMVLWALFFLLGHQNFVLFLIANIAMAGTAAVSGYGFDDIREQMRPEVIGTATGLGNMGAWIGAMIMSQVFGILLNHHEAVNWDAFADSVWFIGFTWLVAAVAIILLRPKRAHS
ncbi:MAG: MFS transporter [Corynebacterium sp.]|nr:MFS transporter [Corynebacterium sp.]